MSKTDSGPKLKTGGKKAKPALICRDKAVLIAQSLEDKKVTDIVVLDVRSVTTIADYFILGTCESQRQVQSSAEHVEEILAKKNVKPLHVEGLQNLHWVLMDYSDVIVHIFDQETREYYALERLWGDAPRVAYTLEGKVHAGRKRA